VCIAASVNELLKAKEDLTAERDAELHEIASLREKLAEMQDSEQKLEKERDEATVKLNEVPYVACSFCPALISVSFFCFVWFSKSEFSLRHIYLLSFLLRLFLNFGLFVYFRFFLIEVLLREISSYSMIVTVLIFVSVVFFVFLSGLQ